MEGYYPYIIGIAVLLCYSIYEVFFKKKWGEVGDNKMFYLFIFFSALFFMTRWYVGWDWYNYQSDFFHDKYNYEIGYRWFVSLVRGIYPNFQFFIGINTVIDFIILGYILKKYSDYPVFTLLLYFLVNGLSLEVDMIRNVKSILLFLISLQFIEKRRVVPYMLLNILGAMFHISSLIYLPVYFILNLKIDRKVIIGIFTVGIVYYMSGFKLLTLVLNKLNIDRLNGYLTLSQESVGEVNIFLFTRILLFLVIYFGFNFIEKKDKERYNILANAGYISIFLYLYMSEVLIVALRLSLLFVFSFWFIIPLILKNLDSVKLFKVLIFIVAIFMGGFKIYNFLSFEGNLKTYRYENIFTKNLSFEEKLKNLEDAKKYNNEGIKRELLLQY